MLDERTPLEIALARQAAGEIDYCDECEYVVVVRGTGYCGVTGKFLLPMMFERGQGSGPARNCKERKEAMKMGLSGSDLARLGPAAQKQVLEKLGKQAQEKDRKYHNQPVDVNGIHFDSRKEANRYMELMALQKAGKIRNLKLQAQYTLQESYITETGERVRAIRYVADFAYDRRHMEASKDKGGNYDSPIWVPVVEDVKSKATRTAKYEMKKKLLRERFGLSITEV